MRIILIDPPYTFDEVCGKKQSFKYVLNEIPSLGLMYLAAAAEQKGHSVEIFDHTTGKEYKELKRLAKEFNPQIIGITATTPTFKNAVYLAAMLREALPGTVFICGGAHTTASPVNSLNSGVFDFIVLGEGEETFLELIGCIENKQYSFLGDICGIAFKRNNKIIITSPRPKNKDLDSIPFPARHLLPPLRTYCPTPASYRKLPLAVIITSRGCPSYCAFCDRAVFGEEVRKRSVTNIIAEVEEVVKKYGAREIRFFDDSFTVDPNHVEGVCCKMRRLYPNIPWTCLTKTSLVNYEMLKMMRASGCWQVLFGLESGNDDVLKYLGKRNTVEQNSRAVHWAKKAGMNVRADFLVGAPCETKETFNETIQFAKNLPLDFAHFNKFIPYPGTAIYRDLTAKGYKIEFNNGAYINNHSDFVYIPEAFNRGEYCEMLNRAYREFYLRPGYILRRLVSMRTFTEFKGNLGGARSIISL